MRPLLFPAMSLAAALSLLAARPSAASVIYILQQTARDAAGETVSLGGFSYASPDFITGERVVPFSDLSSCTVVVSGASCGDQTFRNEPGRDVIDFRVTQPGSLPLAFVSSFDPGAFGAAGVYAELSGFGRLTVIRTGDIAATPEPASWALLIAGFGGVGCWLRRRRARPGALSSPGCPAPALPGG